MEKGQKVERKLSRRRRMIDGNVKKVKGNNDVEEDKQREEKKE